MLNAIRIVIGIIMLYPLVMGLFYFSLFIIPALGGGPSGWMSAISLIFTYIAVPGAAAYLLLNPKTVKQANVGLILAIGFIIFFFMHA